MGAGHADWLPLCSITAAGVALRQGVPTPYTVCTKSRTGTLFWKARPPSRNIYAMGGPKAVKQRQRDLLNIYTRSKGNTTWLTRHWVAKMDVTMVIINWIPRIVGAGNHLLLQNTL